MFIHNAKQNSIFPEICDNLCVEAANSKAIFTGAGKFWIRLQPPSLTGPRLNTKILWISLTPLTDPPCIKWFPRL